MASDITTRNNKNEKQRLNEYYVSPSKDNKDEKHLCKVKNITLEQNIQEKKESFLEKQRLKKYSKTLENINNKIKDDKNTNNEENKNIIVQFDEENGIIIDDRE